MKYCANGDTETCFAVITMMPLFFREGRCLGAIAVGTNWFIIPPDSFKMSDAILLGKRSNISTRFIKGLPFAMTYNTYIVAGTRMSRGKTLP